MCEVKILFTLYRDLNLVQHKLDGCKTSYILYVLQGKARVAPSTTTLNSSIRGIYQRERIREIEMFINGFLFARLHALWTTTDTFTVCFVCTDP